MLSNELARVLTPGSEPGTFLALPPAFVSVGVTGSQPVPPLAVSLTPIDCRERFATSLIHRIWHSIPMSRVLAGPVLTGVATRAAGVPVVAGVVHRLTRGKIAYQQ